MTAKSIALSFTPIVILSCLHVAAWGAAENIVLAGQIAAQIKDRGEFASVRERAGRIDQRISQAISVEDVGQPKVWTKKIDGLWSVSIGDTFLMHCYPADASIYGKTTRQIIGLWKANFKRLFPLAEPSIHMDNPLAGSEAERELATAARAARLSQVPGNDWAITSVVLDYLAQVRSMPEARQTVLGEGEEEETIPCYDDEKTNLAIALISDIAWQQSNAEHYPEQMLSGHTPGKCEDPDCEICARAKAAAIERHEEQFDEVNRLIAATIAVRGSVTTVTNGFRLVRVQSEDDYLSKRVYVAYTLVKKVRGKLATAEKSLPPAMEPPCDNEYPGDTEQAPSGLTESG